MHKVAERLANRVQLATDGHGACWNAVLGASGAFGIDVDYAQHIKIYGPTIDAAGPERKYRPGECCGIRKHRVTGKPVKALVSTSDIEKHNQTMRLHIKRYGRLTAAHTKKIENLVYSMALYATWCNFFARQLGRLHSQAASNRIWPVTRAPVRRKQPSTRKTTEQAKVREVPLLEELKKANFGKLPL